MTEDQFMRIMNVKIGLIFFLAVALIEFFVGCTHQITTESIYTATRTGAAEKEPINYEKIGAGFRYSSYGVDKMPSDDYWVGAGKIISSKLKGTRPEAIWIVGEIISDTGVRLNFPCTSSNPLIVSSQTDRNEGIFDKFDQEGYRIWIQVEPGDVDVIELINIVCSRYKHHPCIVGFGIDVEWYKISGNEDGRAVSDDEAKAWVAAVKQHDKKYKLFLKHWLLEKMPPTERNDIVFINDGQAFNAMTDMVEFFTVWASYFSPSSVGYQFGYLADKKWWGDLADPFQTISQNILVNSPNTGSVFWVDFSILDVFPPDTVVHS